MTAPILGDAPGPVAGGTGALRTDNADQSIGQAADLQENKAERTMQATAAMAGCTLHRLASGGYLLARWGQARELPDLRAVAAMLARMTGRPA